MFAYKFFLSVIAMLVFSVGIQYGQNKQIIFPENNQGTTVIMYDPHIVVHQIVVQQGNQMQQVDSLSQVLPPSTANRQSPPVIPMRMPSSVQLKQNGNLSDDSIVAIVEIPEVDLSYDDSLKYLYEREKILDDSLTTEELDTIQIEMVVPMVSIKSNLLQDFAYMPQYGFCPLWNVAIEYFLPWGNWSVGVSLDIPWWEKKDLHKYIQARNWQIEARRYFFCNKGFDRLFVQAYGNICTFGIGLKTDKSWVGEGFGGGLGVGYVWRFTNRWRLEVGVQTGILQARYDSIIYGDPIDHIDNGYYYYEWNGNNDDFKKRQYRYRWIGPTRASVTIGYNLLLSHRQKGGVR